MKLPRPSYAAALLGSATMHSFGLRAAHTSNATAAHHGLVPGPETITYRIMPAHGSARTGSSMQDLLQGLLNWFACNTKPIAAVQCQTV
jgi:hypothetical protein